MKAAADTWGNQGASGGTAIMSAGVPKMTGEVPDDLHKQRDPGEQSGRDRMRGRDRPALLLFRVERPCPLVGIYRSISADASTRKAEHMEEQASPRVVLRTTLGDVILELDRTAAPVTTENFLSYVSSGQYNGTVFHRVIPDFMIQGGGFSEDMRQKPTADPIANEADNGLKNDRGTIAMARTSEPHSATAQFFINLKDNDFLNHTSKTPQGWGYAVFGKVVDGMDVVDKIAQVKTGAHGPHRDVPADAIVITEAIVEE
jgi:peptidyl-prolyl cis-trans isomerase B (cyclophilin B)